MCPIPALSMCDLQPISAEVQVAILMVTMYSFSLNLKQNLVTI